MNEKDKKRLEDALLKKKQSPIEKSVKTIPPTAYTSEQMLNISISFYEYKELHRQASKYRVMQGWLKGCADLGIFNKAYIPKDFLEGE